jgi:hypothetical protein
LTLATATLVAESFGGDARIASVKKAHAEARDWFDRHPIVGAIALVPMALSKSARSRTLGERGLAAMADKHMPTVLSIASTYGEDVRDAIAEIMKT